MVTVPAWRIARYLCRKERFPNERERRLPLGEVDVLPFAGAPPVFDREEDGERPHCPGERVGVGHAAAEWGISLIARQ